MKVVAKTGLVPVHSKNDANTIFGVEPEKAVKGVKDGSLFLFPIPDGIETYEYNVPSDEKVVIQATTDGGIVIPDDWELLHYAKQIVLAKQLIGEDDLPEAEDKKPVEVARDIIRAEVASRKASPAEATTDSATPATETPAQ